MDHRQEIYEAISEMLDNPDESGIYPTTKCYDRLEAYCKHLIPDGMAAAKQIATLSSEDAGKDERIRQLEAALKPFADAFGYETSTPKSMVKDRHFEAAARVSGRQT